MLNSGYCAPTTAACGSDDGRWQQTAEGAHTIRRRRGRRGSLLQLRLVEQGPAPQPLLCRAPHIAILFHSRAYRLTKQFPDVGTPSQHRHLELCGAALVVTDGAAGQLRLEARIPSIQRRLRHHPSAYAIMIIFKSDYVLLTGIESYQRTIVRSNCDDAKANPQSRQVGALHCLITIALQPLSWLVAIGTCVHRNVWASKP